MKIGRHIYGYAKQGKRKWPTKNISNLTLDDLNGESLEHYGIPGQKCGVRRYQNENGALTDASNAVVARLAMNQAVDRQDK